jgi:hypothetical protein
MQHVIADSTGTMEVEPAVGQCVVAADVNTARLFVRDSADGTMRLVPRARIDNPGARALQSGYANAVAVGVAQLVRDWRSGIVVLAASPHTLGLLRKTVQSVLPPGVVLHVLARDCVDATPEALAELIAHP